MIVRKRLSAETSYTEHLPPDAHMILIPQNDDIVVIEAGLKQLKSAIIEDAFEKNGHDISIYDATRLLSVVTILEDLRGAS